MIEIKLTLSYLYKVFAIKSLLSKPVFSIAILTPTIAIGAMTTTQDVILILIIAFIGDFLTGVYASYVELKSTKSLKKGEATFKVKLAILSETIESEKLRKSFVKAIVYMLFILLVYAFEKVFLLKQVTFSSVSNASFDISIIATSLCILVEVWSIFKENLPRAGFDLVAEIIKIIKGGKKIKDQINK